MLLNIPDVLSQDKLNLVRAILDKARFVDGKLSAGMAAKRVKHNEELPADTRELGQLNNIVMGSLVQHPVYQSAVLPIKVATPFYARYTSGMTYGDHVDDPVMGPPQGRYRSDVSTTVFLNDPDDYEGGELVVRTPFGDTQVKLPAGHAVVYPSSSLHHVAEVSRGERLVAVTWAQSMIRQPDRRELLYGLNLARESLLQHRPDDEQTKRVDVAYVNLIRMWADT
ncbi:MAG: Fe2+-dependent dioxygenase [Proteobacteria bacterium]|jgi:PKHD-type hydroxylase|nr:Fe2+-dependent dioxygenase [Pseudomonadota bacterium]MCG6934302.1 Fe2+-dependent dioxygenase [Pseudomonadota bacterium]